MGPAVLYEAAGKLHHCSRTRADETLTQVIDTIADLGLRSYLIGFENAQQLIDLFRNIAEDEKEIRIALDTIIQEKWERNFSDPINNGMRIPFSLAEEEVPEMFLRYFNVGVVKYLFMHMIERRMFKENKNQPKARNMMFRVSNSAFSVLKKKGGGIEGVGDIELLAQCDLTSQTFRNSPHITMAITHDGALFDTLIERSNVVSTGPCFDAGYDSSEDFSHTLIFSIWESNRRLSQKNKRMSEEYAVSLKEFYNDYFREYFGLIS
jgi:hypothetical protein